MTYSRQKFQDLLLACGAAAVAAVFSMPAMAVPVLQLDISNGTYDASAGEESTITSENVFDLFALGKESSNNFSIDDVFHISAALIPKTGFSNPGDDFGSFNISYTDAAGGVHVNETISVTADMTFGIPPLEANWDAAHDGGDLGSHDIFDTYFYEFSFKFDAGSTIGSYNTQDVAPSAGDLLLETFSFDLSNLQLGYDLHFDLYNTKMKNNGDFDIDYFAPFSHDAGSGRTVVPVPAPATWLLFLLGLGSLLARRAKG
jgi:hypothetical protein